MNIKHLAATAVAFSLLAASGWVQAQPQVAVTARHTNVRAGPAQDYPIVAVLPAGFALSVQGCLPDYTWCDVIAGQSRGWMWAGNINYYYQNSYVPLLNYGPAIGIGALGFFLGDYWGSHYRDRPFYRDRYRWEGRRYPEPRYEPRHDPRYDPQRPGYIGPRGDQLRPDGRRERPRAEVPAPRLDPRRGDQPRATEPPKPGETRREQRERNQGGSTSVDESLKPHY
jgi:uncharacterized protein YraI